MSDDTGAIEKLVRTESANRRAHFKAQIQHEDESTTQNEQKNPWDEHNAPLAKNSSHSETMHRITDLLMEVMVRQEATREHIRLVYDDVKIRERAITAASVLDIVSEIFTHTTEVTQTIHEGLKSCVTTFAQQRNVSEPFLLLRQMVDRSKDEINKLLEPEEAPKKITARPSTAPHPPPVPVQVTPREPRLCVYHSRRAPLGTPKEHREAAMKHANNIVAEEGMTSDMVPPPDFGSRVLGVVDRVFGIKQTVIAAPTAARSPRSARSARSKPTTSPRRPPPNLSADDMTDLRARSIVALAKDLQQYRSLRAEEKQFVHQIEQSELIFHHNRALVNMKLVGWKKKPASADRDATLSELNRQREGFLKQRRSDVDFAWAQLVRLKRVVPLVY